MTRIAEAARHKPDPRVSRLVDWIKTNLCPGLPPIGSGQRPTPPAAWNPRRVLIFTEYTDTKRYLEQQLEAAIAGTDRAADRIRTFHGGMGEDTREEIKRAFNADPAKHPLRILIATDAAREGVNLQNHCADLFHFDVPWNPGRMEQRNGRIDRKLQKAPEVRCHYFFYRQRPQDRVLQALVRKSDTIAKELGSLIPVVERRLEKLLHGGIRGDQADAVAQAIDAEQAAGRRTRRSTRSSRPPASARTSCRSSSSACGRSRPTRRSRSASRRPPSATPSPSRCASSAPTRSKAESGQDDERPHPLDLPGRSTSGPARAPPGPTRSTPCAPPRKRDQKPWEWRKDAKPRPVVFEDSGSLDDDTVHLHLEHRVVQRLLGRFLAQGFVHDDLSRACLGQTQDPIPRVLVLGRLSLYGEGAARLHDEVLIVAARWTDPAGAEGEPQALRKGRRADGREPPEGLARGSAAGRRARAHAREAPGRDRPRHGGPAPAPEAAGRGPGREGDREAEGARREGSRRHERRPRAAARADREAGGPVRDEAARAGVRRGRAPPDRGRQEALAAPARCSSRDELEREPERIRKAYEVKATRIEPLGVVYLWPVSG